MLAQMMNHDMMRDGMMTGGGTMFVCAILVVALFAILIVQTVLLSRILSELRRGRAGEPEATGDRP